MTHAPEPCKQLACGSIRFTDSNGVGWVSHPDHLRDCVNSWPKMVDALEWAVNFIESNEVDERMDYEDGWAECKEALAKAKEKPNEER